MSVANFDLDIVQGAAFEEVFRWTYENGEKVPLNGYTAYMEIREKKSTVSDLIIRVTDLTIDSEEGTIRVFIPASETNNFNFIYAYYDIFIVPPAGSDVQEMFVQGEAFLNSRVTEFDANIFPPADVPAVPTIGQINTEDDKAILNFAKVAGASNYQIDFQGEIFSIGDVNVYAFEDLDPNILYSFRLRGTNSIGLGDWTAEVFFTTKTDITPNVFQLIPSRNGVTIEFEEEGGLILEYNLDGNWITASEFSPYEIENLEEDEPYAGSLRFSNGGGAGPSTSISFSTLPPAPVEIPTASLISSSSTGGTFSRSSSSGAESYEYSMNGGLYQNIGKDNPFTATGGDPNSPNLLRLRARNAGGVSESSLLLFNTLAALPQNQDLLTLSSASDSGLIVNVAELNQGTLPLNYFLSIEGTNYINVGLGDYEYMGLNPDQDYTVALRIRNEQGDTIDEEIHVFSTLTVIGTPTFDEANFANTNSSITGAWNTLAGATGYRVQLSNGTIQDVGNVTSYQFVDLEQANDYIYKLQAYSGTSQSVWIQIPVQTDDSVLIETTDSGYFTP